MAPENKTVCICIPCLNIGGTEMQAFSQAKVLRSLDYKVYMICYFEYIPSVVTEFQRAGVVVRLTELNRKTDFIHFIITLCKEIRSIKPEIVHVQYMSPGALPIFAARIAGVKTVLATVHQPYTKEHGLISKIILRAASLLTTKFIAVSLNAEKSWFGSASLFDENIAANHHVHHFTIYNNIDSGKIHEIINTTDISSVRSHLKLPEDLVLVGVVSRLSHEKGIDLLIAAFSLLMKEGVRIKLLIIGSGPDETKLQDQANYLEISDRIIFYGVTEWENVIKLMAAIDIFVVPSRFEGFGLTAAEAMAAGKPVIASAIFGLKEVVTDNETGILFPVNNVVALKSAIRRLLDNPELREKFGKAGKERVNSDFSAELYFSKIRALYNISYTV